MEPDSTSYWPEVAARVRSRPISSIFSLRARSLEAGKRGGTGCGNWVIASADLII
jgi:hypothetical protein